MFTNNDEKKGKYKGKMVFTLLFTIIKSNAKTCERNLAEMFSRDVICVYYY